MIAIDKGGTVSILATSSAYTVFANQNYTVNADLNGTP